MLILLEGAQPLQCVPPLRLSVSCVFPICSLEYLFGFHSRQLMIAAHRRGRMDRLAVVEYFQEMKKDGRLQVLRSSIFFSNLWV